VILLAASGAVFSAGGDLAWMRRMGEASRADNVADAGRLADLLRTIDRSPLPTIARVQGSAFGGALGLIAACDIAIAVDAAEFAASEVRLGLIPATISPYVVRAIGPRAARRLFLTGLRIGVGEAQRIGLIHEVVPAVELDAAVARTIAALSAGGPQALAATKRLVAEITPPVDDATIERTVEALAEARTGDEAREGAAAFLAKRQPKWLR
jgi:methylglutaconyl-CoA hydratase